MRTIRLFMAAACAVAATFVIATPAVAQTPQITVSPDTGLSDGQSVTVTGTDWPPTTVLISQCDWTNGMVPANCDDATETSVTADANGDFNLQFSVSLASCAPSNGGDGNDNCAIYAETSTGGDDYPIHFTPSTTSGTTTGATDGTTSTTAGTTDGTTGSTTGDAATSATSAASTTTGTVTSSTTGTTTDVADEGLPQTGGGLIVGGVIVAGLGIAGALGRRRS